MNHGNVIFYFLVISDAFVPLEEREAEEEKEHCLGGLEGGDLDWSSGFAAF